MADPLGLVALEGAPAAALVAVAVPVVAPAETRVAVVAPVAAADNALADAAKRFAIYREG